MPHVVEFGTQSIGGHAFELVARPGQGTVAGTTSRGVFVRVANRITFLTSQPYRGPLTANVLSAETHLAAVSAGSPVKIGQGVLLFPDAGFSVAARPETVWSPPAVLAPAPDPARFEALVALAGAMLAENRDVGLGRVLGAWLGLPAAQPLTPGDLALLSDCKSLRSHLSREEIAPAVKIIVKFLGVGPGLTPSGDDFTMGLLLSLNRYPAGFIRRESLDRLNGEVRAAARRRTTLLGASLIACAADGEADERLLAALDAVWSGQHPTPAVTAGLLGWGASSGSDALAGMAVAMRSARPGGPTRSKGGLAH